MIDLYYWPTPNGLKLKLFMEEAGLPHRTIPVNIGKGEQIHPNFLAIAPNNRIPALVDHDPADGGAPHSLFESGAMLLYLAEKIGRFIPTDLRGRVVHLRSASRIGYYDFGVNHRRPAALRQRFLQEQARPAGSSAVDS